MLSSSSVPSIPSHSTLNLILESYILANIVSTIAGIIGKKTFVCQSSITSCLSQVYHK